MRERLSRPGLVWAIAMWYFGWSAVIVAFVCLVFTDVIHLTASHRMRLDAVVSHSNIANLVGWTMMLIGAGLLFRLRKSAYYLFIAAFAGNCLIATWFLRKDGWEGGQEIIKLAFALGVPLILGIYSRHLAAKGILT
jgi:hypothetical protein